MAAPRLAWRAPCRLAQAACGGAAAGLLAAAAARAPPERRGGARCLQREVAFSKDEFRRFPVKEVRECGPMTKVITCQLPSESHSMGMTVSSYVLVGGAEGGDVGSGAYTPVSTDDQLGYFELLVKGYPDGVVSKHLCSLRPGDFVEVKGPFLKLPYKANMKRRIGMIAGGSGITPMLQIIKQVLRDPGDKTELTLLFCNRSPGDILIRAELDRLAESSGGQLRVLYVVDRNDTGDARVKHVGHVTKEFLAAVLPAPSPDALICVCGPPAMVGALAGPKKFRKEDPNPRGHPFYGQGGVAGLLQELRYEETMVYKF